MGTPARGVWHVDVVSKLGLRNEAAGLVFAIEAIAGDFWTLSGVTRVMLSSAHVP